MPYYLGAAIGPIYGLLKEAKTGRELWVASYFLSKLAGLLVDYTSTDATIALQRLSPQPVTGSTYGAGVYPDYIYWQTDRLLDPHEIENIKSDIITQICKDIANKPNASKPEDYLLKPADLEAYIRIYFVQVLEEADKKPGTSFLFRINQAFDVLELQNKWQPSGKTNIIENLIAKGEFKDPKQRPIYKWRKEAGQTNLVEYQVDGGVERFPSIIEITTRPLVQHDKEFFRTSISAKISGNLSALDKAEKNKIAKEEVEMDERLMATIKRKFKETHFRSHHKYLCIVQSDGDRVGAFLKEKVGNDTGKLEDFSQKLNQFSIESGQVVEDYGGRPIFAGGDDLLFLAPVTHQTEKDCNIFHLLKSLNKKFEVLFSGFEVSVSFGVSVTYYKHPMSESLETAANLLFNDAKQQKPLKNYAATKVQKHSGQTFDIGIRQAGGFYDAFLQLTKAAGLKEENFLNSFMYKIDDQQKVIDRLCRYYSQTKDGKPQTDEEQKIIQKRLTAFFKENFNEAVHQERHADAEGEMKDKFFAAAHKLILNTYVDYAAATTKQKMEKIYGALRFVHFLNAKDTDE